MEGRSGEGERGGKHAHQWYDDRCRECGLRRQEAWTLDAQGRSVLTLVWSSESGRVVRVRPFAYLLGIMPRVAPTQVAEEAYPGIRIGKEPKCPHEPFNWDAERSPTADIDEVTSPEGQG